MLVKEVSDNHLQRICDSIEGVSNKITSSVENWHQYLYDEQFYNIAYEQREMYNPWGNKVKIRFGETNTFFALNSLRNE